MRLHAYPGNPDYSYALRNSTVYLDGEKQHRCVFADEENGVVLRYVLDEKGALMVRGNEIETEQVKGVVKIVPPVGAK